MAVDLFRGVPLSIKWLVSILKLSEFGETGAAYLAVCSTTQSELFKSQITDYILEQCNVKTITKNWNAPNFEMIYTILSFFTSLKLNVKISKTKSITSKMAKVKLHLMKYTNSNERINVYIRLKMSKYIIDHVKQINTCTLSNYYFLSVLFSVVWKELVTRLTSYDGHSKINVNYNVYMLNKMLETVKFEFSTNREHHELEHNICVFCCKLNDL